MMATGGSERREDRLGPRARDVLKSVVREHVLTGEPVGSRTVSQGGIMGLSPATIRSIMAALEEQGYLRQPHPSAGRVPTDEGYRVYVDQLMDRRRMAPSQARQIEEALKRNRGKIPEMLGEASRQLSRVSRQLGIVMAPEFHRIVVEHLEFVRLGPRRIVAIVVGRSGFVHNRILHNQEPYDQDELDRIGRYLTDEFGGKTLPEMREELRRRIQEERAVYDRLFARSVDLGRRAVETRFGDVEVFIEGTSNLVGFPEFADPVRMRALFRTLEEKSRLVDLLGRVLAGEGVQVVIGQENPVTDLSDCSLVASSYASGDRVMGTVGIVGPTRMPYGRAVALVGHLAEVLSRLLSGGER